MKQRSCGLETIATALIVVVSAVAVYMVDIDESVADGWDSVTLWVEGGETQQLANYWKVKLTEEDRILWISYSPPNPRKMIWAIMTSPILKGAPGKTYPTFADGVTIRGLLMIGGVEKTMEFDKEAMRDGGDGVRKLEDQALLMALEDLQNAFALFQSSQEVSLIFKVRSGNEVQSELRMLGYEYHYHLKGKMPNSYQYLRDIQKNISETQQRTNWRMESFDLQIGLFTVTDKGLEMMHRRDVVNLPLEYKWQIHRGFDTPVQASTRDAAKWLSEQDPWDSDHYLIVSMKETLKEVLFSSCETSESGLLCDTPGHIDAEEVDNDRDAYAGYVERLLREAVLKKMMRNLLAEIQKGLNAHLTGDEALGFSKFILEVDNFKPKAQLSDRLRSMFEKLTTVRDEVFARFRTEAGLRLESIKRIMKASDDAFINSRRPIAESHWNYTEKLQKNWGPYFDKVATNALSKLRKRLGAIIAKRKEKEQGRATYRATVGPDSEEAAQSVLNELSEQVATLVHDSSAKFSDTQAMLGAVEGFRKNHAQYENELKHLTTQLQPAAYWGRWKPYLFGMLSEYVAKGVLNEILAELNALIKSAKMGAPAPFDELEQQKRLILRRVKDAEKAEKQWNTLKVEIKTCLDGNENLQDIKHIKWLQQELREFQQNLQSSLAEADKADIKILSDRLKQKECSEKWKEMLSRVDDLLGTDPLDLKSAQKRIDGLRQVQSGCSNSPDVQPHALEILNEAMRTLKVKVESECWERLDLEHFNAKFDTAAAGQIQRYFACEFCSQNLNRKEILLQTKTWHPDKNPLKSLHGVTGFLTGLAAKGFEKGNIHNAACLR